MSKHVAISGRDIEKLVEKSSISFHGVKSITIEQRLLKDKTSSWFCGHITFNFINANENEQQISFHGEGDEPVSIFCEDNINMKKSIEELEVLRHRIAVATEILEGKDT